MSEQNVNYVGAYPYDCVNPAEVAHLGHGDRFPFVADAWYYQIGDQWMAVVRDWEPEDTWFESGEWPTPCTYPINQRPPFGTLTYRRPDGTEVTDEPAEPKS